MVNDKWLIFAKVTNYHLNNGISFMFYYIIFL